jgi:NAD-dependent deacetylase
MENKTETLAHLLTDSEYAIVISGAGISTESGIPDFRSSNGLWENQDAVELLSLKTLYGDPWRFYDAGFELLKTFMNKTPNNAHKAVARLEQMGLIKSVITQNIDGLHQMAGAKNVIEIHGNLRNAYCDSCGGLFSLELIRISVEKKRIPPPCPNCRGVLRPDVVFFDDQMQDSFITAIDETKKADFALIIGSSLSVAPAAYLPSSIPSIAIVNLTPTPYDERAKLVIRDKAGTTMSRLLNILTAKEQEIRQNQL